MQFQFEQGKTGRSFTVPANAVNVSITANGSQVAIAEVNGGAVTTSVDVPQGAAVVLNYDIRPIAGKTIPVGSSRGLVAETDDGKTLEPITSGVDLTLPAGLINFGCAVIKNGTTRIVPDEGVLINGANAIVTVTAEVGAIVPLTAANQYKAVGVS